jgi:hypothetical protein
MRIARSCDLKARHASWDIKNPEGTSASHETAIAIARIHGDPSYLEPILRTTLDGLRPPHGGEPA